MATPPVFTAGAVLTAAQMNGIGLWLVKTQTIGSAVSSVTVTDAFSADYDNYLVTVSGGVGSTAQAITMQLGSTTTGYYYGSLNVFWTGTTAVTNGNNGASITVGFSDTSNNGAWVNVRQPNLAKPTIINSVGSDVRTSGGASNTNDGFESSTTQHTAFTLAVTGTMTGGTIRVYGYRN